MVHRREIDGNPVVFGNQGDLWNNALTLFDHETGSVWSQVTGTAILGPLTNTSLELLPSELAVWSEWREQFPDTLALATRTNRHGFQVANLTVVAQVNGETAGLKFADLEELGSISTVLGGEPIVFVAIPELERWAVFSRLVDGVEREVELVDGLLEDPLTGDQWDPATGRPLTAQPLLERTSTFSANFVDWQAFFPDGAVLVEPEFIGNRQIVTGSYIPR